MNRKILFAAVLTSLLFSSCSSSVSSYRSSESYNASANRAANVAAPSAAKQVASETGGAQQPEPTQSAPTPVERKIIRNADLTLETGSPEESQKKIADITASKKGYVIESQQSSSSSNIKTSDVITMTVRVPSEKFDESVDEIRKASDRVIVETVKGQDVTEEYVDVEARLKAKKALEAQFLEIMKQARTVEDTLKVQKELGNVRAEIEQVEGRLRFLENQTSLSTIKIRLQTPNSVSPSSYGFFYQLKEALSDGFEGALALILFFVRALIALLPFLVLIVLPIYLLIRYFWRRQKKQKAANEIAREEIRSE